MLAVFLAYHIVSLVIAGAATVAVFILYLKTRSPRLPPFLAVNILLGLLVASLSYELLCMIDSNICPATRGIVHEAEQFLCLALCAVVPQISGPPIPGRPALAIGRCFAIGSGLIAIIFSAVLLLPHGETVYMIMYGLIYLDLTLMTLYFILVSVFFRKRAPVSSTTRHYSTALSILGMVTTALLPALFVVDFFGWMVPFINARLPKGLSLLPLFCILMSLTMLVRPRSCPSCCCS